MSNELSVYKQLAIGTNECLAAIKREIGMKTTCIPFAVKLVEAMSSLSPKSEQEELNAANTLLSGLQALMQGGIKAEDYDKIDFVKRGGVIVPSARVEAFYRAAARKGYRITDTIVAVPKEDFETTYFKENFYNGDIVYTLEDIRRNPDRAVNANRMISGYFSKFLCRLDVHDVKQNKRVVMTVCEMSIDDMLSVASASEQGLYKSEWQTYKDKNGKERKRKVITDKLNDDTAFWVKWTGEMVNKSIIRRALKRIKEVLPELTETILAFEQDEYIEAEARAVEEAPMVEIPVRANDVNMNKLTDEQRADCAEFLEMCKANPKLADDELAEIKRMFESGKPKQEIINEKYASVYVLRCSKKRWAEIGGYFEIEKS